MTINLFKFRKCIVELALSNMVVLFAAQKKKVKVSFFCGKSKTVKMFY